MRSIAFMVLLTGCVRDTIRGDWEGEMYCNGQDYDVEARFQEDETFVYSGQMLFAYEEAVVVSGESATFEAILKYEFTTTQPARAGGQDIYLDMEWTKLFCSVKFEDGTTEDGGCLNIGGIDDSDKGESVGFVEMRYSGTNRLSIDDDNCEGSLYWTGE